ncbi:MAG: hypothetical protein M0Z82_06430, partial [Actinomycetota bacterium]|nr:hypothetical protein [Actinomycetota bacterium]
MILATTDAGRVWHVETYPSGLGLSGGSLAGVSCSNASFCVAVGEGNHPVILATTDAGRVWHVETYPSGLGLS